MHGGEAEHIDQKLALEEEQIGQRQEEIRQQREEEVLRLRDEHDHGKGGNEQDGDGGIGLCRRDLAGRERALALGRVAPIRLDILDVVQEIDRGGDQAEGDEGDQAEPKRVRIEGVVVEQDGDEDEAVLEPMVRPHRSDHRGHRHGSTRLPKTWVGFRDAEPGHRLDRRGRYRPENPKRGCMWRRNGQ